MGGRTPGRPDSIIVFAVGILTVALLLTFYILNNVSAAPTSLFPIKSLTNDTLKQVESTLPIEWNTTQMQNVTELFPTPSSNATNTMTPRHITYSICALDCDFDNLNDALQAVIQNTNITKGDTAGIVIKRGELMVDVPADLVSNLSIEFEEGSKIIVNNGFSSYSTVSGNFGKNVFQGTNLKNITITNPVIESTYESGVAALSFTNSSNIKLTGGDISLVKGSQSAGLMCRDCSNVNVTRLHVISASRLIDINTSNLTRNGDSSKIWIVNNSLEDASIEGIKVNFSNDVHIIGNSIYKTANNGIDVGGSENAEIMNNRLESTGTGHASGIHTDSAENVVIDSNTILNSGGVAINICGAKGVTVNSNTIKETLDSAIIVTRCFSELDSVNTVINNNTIADAGKDGIFVSANQTNVFICQNVIIMDPYQSQWLPVRVLQPNLSVTETGTKVTQN